MVYTTPRKIYDRTSLTQEDVDEFILVDLISDATNEINNKINSKVIRERVKYIDSFRENLIDGLNKKYYVQKAKKGTYFGDMNNSGTITTADILVEILDNTDTETVATVSAIDYDDMSFTLSTAPASSTQAIYVTYCYTYFDVVTPDMLIEMATRYLVSAYAYAKLEYSLGDNIRIGNISISGLGRTGSSGENKYLSRYNEVLKEISSFGNTKNLPVSHIRI